MHEVGNDQGDDRGRRRGRTRGHGLFLIAGILFVYLLFFADSGERAVVQATMMGAVAVVVSSLLLLWFLDNPYHGGVGA